MSRKQKKMLARILVSAALLIALNFIPVAGWPRVACYMAPYLSLIHILTGLRPAAVALRAALT